MFTSCLTERPGSRNFVTGNPVTASSLSAISYGKTVYPITKQYCSKCHDNPLQDAPQQFFSDVDRQHLYVLQKQFVNIDKVEESALVERLKTNHNCWTNCEDNALEMKNAIIKWIPFLDKKLLAPPGYQTEELNYLSGTDAVVDDPARTGKILTFNLDEQIESPTTISIQIELDNEPENGLRGLYAKIIILNPTIDDVFIQDVRVLVNGEAIAANIFSFISDVISPTSPPERKELSQDATAFIPIDENDNDPKIQLVIKQLRVY